MLGAFTKKHIESWTKMLAITFCQNLISKPKFCQNSTNRMLYSPSPPLRVKRLFLSLLSSSQHWTKEVAKLNHYTRRVWWMRCWSTALFLTSTSSILLTQRIKYASVVTWENIQFAFDNAWYSIHYDKSSDINRSPLNKHHIHHAVLIKELILDS